MDFAAWFDRDSTGKSFSKKSRRLGALLKNAPCLPLIVAVFLHTKILLQHAPKTGVFYRLIITNCCKYLFLSEFASTFCWFCWSKFCCELIASTQARWEPDFRPVIMPLLKQKPRNENCFNNRPFGRQILVVRWRKGLEFQTAGFCLCICNCLAELNENVLLLRGESSWK